MPHEIFLTCLVGQDQAFKARSLLFGFTGSAERHQYRRIQHCEAHEPSVKGLSTTVKQLQKERVPTTPQWQELHQILAKQPSVLQLRTDITEEVENCTNAATGGETAALVDIPAGKPCAVRWADLPDPTNRQVDPAITQRRVLEIADPRAEKVLADNKFKFKSDLIEESYRWWSDGIEFCLTRLFAVPPSPNPTAPRQIPNPATLEPVGTNWFLYVYAKVDPNPIATMPARMKEGQDTLVQIKQRFRGVFEFMAFDRRCRDTRLQEPRRA